MRRGKRKEKRWSGETVERQRVNVREREKERERERERRAYSCLLCSSQSPEREKLQFCL